MNRLTSLLLCGMLAALASGPAVAAGTLRVEVVGPSGRAVTDARVTLVELRRSDYVDESGAVEFDDVPAGAYHVEAISGRFGSVVDELELTEAEALTVRLELARSVHRERIVVTATPGGRGSAEVVIPIDILDEEELNERMKPTLGETLAQEPGIHSTFFGSGASRPIIRGQGGGRVSVLEGGLGVGDASTTSPDHAVSSDPINATTIEVVRGPAALLYDSSAIGGLVNIIDGRIPDHAPRKAVVGSFDLRLASAADERTGAVDLTGGNRRFAWHVDASRRTTDDYETPDGVLPNSAVENSTVTLGLSALFANGYIGVSGRRFDSEYGIQGIALEPAGTPPGAADDGGVVIDMQQSRFDLRGGFDLGRDRFVNKISLGLGSTDYEHTEFEDGVAGTLFFNESREARVELAHRQHTASPGVIGMQYRDRDARAVGDEAFVPETSSDTLALFALQEIETGPVRLEFGGRFEMSELAPGAILPEIADRIATNPNCSTPLDASFDDLSASAGLVWLDERGYAVGASLSHAVRSPGSEELYSCGPHLATQSFEVGDVSLREETGLELNVNLRKRRGRLTGELSLFTNRFDDYIHETFTGRILTEDGAAYDPAATPDPELLLPEFRFTQADAEFYGAELQALVDLYSDDEHHLDLEFTGDLVRARLRDTDEYLPRIPAARVGVGLQYRGDRWYGSMHVQRTSRQDRLSPSETITSTDVDGLELIGGPSAGYTLIRAGVGYRQVRSGILHDFSLRGTNLTDRTARVHTSRLKNVAPLPGLDLSLAYRLVF